MLDQPRIGSDARVSRLVCAGRGLVCAAAACFLGGCRNGVLDPQGPVAAAERIILLDSVAIMLAVIVPVIIATLWVAWWFRASNPRARRILNFAYSGRIEFIVWAIPALIIMFLGGIAWISSHELDPYKPLESKTAPLEIEAVSLDWKWLFIYPDQDIASVNHLVVPAGTPLHFKLTSATVMNSFFVPQLGSQIYTMAGMVTQLNLQAGHPGVYPGLSAQFSGAGFADMHFNVDAVSNSDFAAWVEQQRQAPAHLDQAAYLKLDWPQLAPVLTYSAVDPGLFDAILAQPVMAAPIPPETRPSYPPVPTEK